MRRVTAVAGSGGGASFVEDELAQIVHDLKTPLSAIALEATLMDTWLVTGDRTRCVPAVARIQDNVEFLDRVVQDLLDVCAFAAGTLELRRGPVELSALIDRVIERVAGAARDRIALEVGRPVVAKIDDIRIQRVIANLLDNALRYSPESSRVLVSLSATRTHARLSVSDSGPGIPSDELAHVFERYRRGRFTSGHCGSGLGLYTCKRIVEAHGGAIRVHSIRHVGTRFTVELPL